MMNRRDFIRTLTLAGAGAMVLSPAAFSALNSDNKFIFILLRGGMDGLGALPPIGDRDFAKLRGRDIDHSAYKPLDAIFALHPSLQHIHRLYQAGQAAIIPALAAPYRGRSHFDAQDMLEYGVARKNGMRSGWMARTADIIAEQQHGNSETAIALAGALPISLQGTINALAWAPDRLPDASGDLIARLADLYSDTPVLAQAFDKARKSDDIAVNMPRAMMERSQISARNNAKKEAFIQLASAAGNFLKVPGGPALAFMELGGWDTHSAQHRRLTQQLDTLDAGIKALKTSLGSVWQNSTVLVMSEFGRTVNFNGSNGTDHGTAGAGFLLGGAVKGGRMVGDWPGLKVPQLYEERDLRSTIDAYSVIANVLRDHMHIDPAAISKSILPDYKGTAAKGLIV